MKFGLFVLLALLLSGCTSIRSTMLNRTEDDDFVGNSNGDPKECGMTRPFKGVPITMKVPTHVDVRIIETYYLYNSDSGLTQLRTRHRNLGVETAFVMTEKVFTVDFKRPLSGTIDYAATFGPDQYFDTIKTKVVDTTITDVTALVAAAIPLFTTPVAALSGSTIASDVIVDTRAVAFRRFDMGVTRTSRVLAS